MSDRKYFESLGFRFEGLIESTNVKEIAEKIEQGRILFATVATAKHQVIITGVKGKILKVVDPYFDQDVRVLSEIGPVTVYVRQAPRDLGVHDDQNLQVMCLLSIHIISYLINFAPFERLNINLNPLYLLAMIAYLQVSLRQSTTRLVFRFQTS
eukprot:TRINITY_DN8679_c0_g1_i2.p1 TRINITY_DN8679_c0_g1~~TRINITY_DN8679_c0_g1_i2.p1  ORF type:complete len:154 (-),score=13.69 TRINITY_DN8679_c0_g1_i2:144-605(-)